MLSILGFNLGIELMQLLVIAVTIPWLIILSRNKTYIGFRIAGAVIAAIASIACVTERISGQSNFISGFILAISSYGIWIILLLVIAALISYLNRKKASYIINKNRFSTI